MIIVIDKNDELKNALDHLAKKFVAMHSKIQAYQGITNYLSPPPPTRSNPINTSRNSSTPTTLLFVVNQDVDKLEESSQGVSSDKVKIDILLSE